jgi:predicted phage baseplate assembly protein
VPGRFENIRADFYQQTIGAAGNLPSGQQWRVDRPGFSGVIGTNFHPAAGGSDAEPLDEAEIRARKEFNTVYRAVTLADYERLAMSVPGLPIARAKAIPNFDPEYRCIKRPGIVTVVVVPDFWDERPFVEPGERFIEVAQSYLNQRRLITNEVRVVGPEYVKISVKCTVFVKHKSSTDDVTKRIDKALKRFLSPLERRPEDLDAGTVIKAWPFGRPVYPSEIYELIDKIEGVDYLTDVQLEADGPYQNKKGVFEIRRTGLVYSGTHEIEARLKPKQT